MKARMRGFTLIEIAVAVAIAVVIAFMGYSVINQGVKNHTELKEQQAFSTAADDAKGETGKTSVQILVAVEGCGVVEAQGCDPVTLAKGDAVVIPAAVQDFTVRPQWTVEFLKACLPAADVPEPATRQ